MAALIIALLEHKKQSEIVRTSLHKAGHEVIVGETFSSAKAILQNASCDLIISDVHLQNGGSVFDFLRWARHNHQSKHIPFVMLSLEPTEVAKYLGDGVKSAAQVLGASKYISMEKFDSDLLVEQLAEFLPKSETRDISDTVPVIRS